jgi:hypothetical protein
LNDGRQKSGKQYPRSGLHVTPRASVRTWHVPETVPIQLASAHALHKFTGK